MLSNPLHRFSTYSSLSSSSMLSNGPMPSSQIHSSGLDGLSSSPYALHRSPQQAQRPQIGRGNKRQHPYNGQSGARASNGHSGPVRRRISRACDQCNQLRTKCDGQTPCAHCLGRFSKGLLELLLTSVQSLAWAVST